MPPLIQAESTFQTELISGKQPKRVCVIVPVWLCLLKTKQPNNPKCTDFSLQPALSPLDITWTLYSSETIYRMMKARVTLWPLKPVCSMCQTAVTASSWNIARFWFIPVSNLVSLHLLYFKFSSWLYVFLSYWFVITPYTVAWDGFISFSSHCSYPLFIVYMPLYIPFCCSQTLLFISPPTYTTTLLCSFTLRSLPSCLRGALPCIRFSSGI